MSTSTVRIPENTHRKLRDLAAATGQPMSAVLSKAVEAYRRQLFFDIVDAQLAELQKDDAAWQDYLQDRDAWDVTLADDLEGDTWPNDG